MTLLEYELKTKLKPPNDLKIKKVHVQTPIIANLFQSLNFHIVFSLIDFMFSVIQYNQAEDDQRKQA